MWSYFRDTTDTFFDVLREDRVVVFLQAGRYVLFDFNIQQIDFGISLNAWGLLACRIQQLCISIHCDTL